MFRLDKWVIKKFPLKNTDVILAALMIGIFGWLVDEFLIDWTWHFPLGARGNYLFHTILLGFGIYILGYNHNNIKNWIKSKQQDGN